jgi:hypothetical protein
MEIAVEMGSGAMLYMSIPNFIKLVKAFES